MTGRFPYLKEVYFICGPKEYNCHYCYVTTNKDMGGKTLSKLPTNYLVEETVSLYPQKLS